MSAALPPVDLERLCTTTNRKQRRAAGRFPSTQVTNRLAERAEVSGCDQCGDRFAEYAPYYIVRCRGGSFSARCPDCLADTIPLGIGTYIGGGDPWSGDDRNWFGQHPTRRWRLRDPWPGELEAMAVGADARSSVTAFAHNAAGLGMRLAIATFQAEAGKRMRNLIAFSSHDPLASYTDAGIEKFCPDLADVAAAIAALSDADWQRIHRERSEARLRDTMSAGKGEAAAL